MQLDDEVCLCFHVTKRKLLNYIRLERPQRPAQLADCFGAGTGCGWCRKYLSQLHTAAVAGDAEQLEDVSFGDHAQGRSEYVRGGGGVPPPGATPA